MGEKFQTMLLLASLLLLVVNSSGKRSEEKGEVDISGHCDWEDPYSVRHRDCDVGCQKKGYYAGYCAGLMATTCRCSRDSPHQDDAKLIMSKNK